MHDKAACLAPGCQHSSGCRNDGLQGFDLVAQRFAKAARLDKITLHVDDQQCRSGKVQFKIEWLGMIDLFQYWLVSSVRLESGR